MASGSRKHWLKRVFALQLHPVEDKRILRPVFWRSCFQQQLTEKEQRILHDDTSVESRHEFIHPQSVLEIADIFVSEEDCNLKGYGSTDADAVKYSDAVLGASGKVDANGMKISHVGEATRSSSSENWEPWVGQRTLRPITIAHTGRGATIRNRFCFNADERERRHRDQVARSRADETVLESSDTCDSSDVLPDVDSTRWQEGGELSDSRLLLEDLFDDYVFDDPEVFWDNLDDSLPVQAVPGHFSAAAEFDLFEHSPDQVGVCSAVLDTLSLIEDGRVGDVDLCLATIDRVLGSLPNSGSDASLSATDRLAAIRARVVAKFD